MSSPHEISEYIDNLPLHKTLCKGYRPDEVYDVICNISSMYNQILADVHEENDELKKKLQHMEVGNSARVSPVFDQETRYNFRKEEKMDNFFNREKIDRFDKEEPFAFEKEDGKKADEKSGETMTDKELQKLKRGELLEILLEQSRENESLKIQLEEKDKLIAELKEQLENRRIDIKNAGTIAEASLKLNGVFEAAEKAAQQYLENLQILYDKEKYEYTKRESEIESRCSALVQATKERCDFMKEETLKKCEDMEASVKKQCEALYRATEMKCKEKEKEAEEKCMMLDQKAKTDVDNRWNDLSRRLEDFYTAHEGLRDLLTSSKMI